MIKAIIFDLNGVFIKSQKLSDRFEKDFGISSEEFMPALKEIMSHTYKPSQPEAFVFWKPYFVKWNVNFSQEQFYDYWFGAEKPDQNMIELAKDLKAKGFKIFILSNNLQQRSEYYAQYFQDLIGIFDKVYYSWQTGFIKPDPKAFELIMQENYLEPEECSYLFKDAEDTSRKIDKNIKSI